MVTGWVERPRREQPSTSSACWRLAGTVTNRSDTAVWDVQVRLLDAEGSLVPTPVLVRAVLPPNTEWVLWWAAGHAFPPFPGSGEAPGPVPVPKAITDPGARLQLEVTFTDAAGQRSRRHGATVTPETDSTGPVAASSSQIYSRALEHLADLGEHQNEVPRGDPPGGPAHALLADLYGALDEASREHFGPVYRPAAPNLLANTAMNAGYVPSLLTEDPTTWVITDSYTEQLHGVRVLAGAVHGLTSVLQVGEAGGLSAVELTGRVCSVLTALGALGTGP